MRYYLSRYKFRSSCVSQNDVTFALSEVFSTGDAFSIRNFYYYFKFGPVKSAKKKVNSKSAAGCLHFLFILPLLSFGLLLCDLHKAFVDF